MEGIPYLLLVYTLILLVFQTIVYFVWFVILRNKIKSILGLKRTFWSFVLFAFFIPNTLLFPLLIVGRALDEKLLMTLEFILGLIALFGFISLILAPIFLFARWVGRRFLGESRPAPEDNTKIWFVGMIFVLLLLVLIFDLFNPPSFLF